MARSSSSSSFAPEEDVATSSDAESSVTATHPSTMPKKKHAPSLAAPKQAIGMAVRGNQAAGSTKHVSKDKSRALATKRGHRLGVPLGNNTKQLPNLTPSAPIDNDTPSDTMAPRNIAPTAPMVLTSPDLFVRNDDTVTVTSTPDLAARFSGIRPPRAERSRAESAATLTGPSDQHDIVTFIVGENATTAAAQLQDPPNARRDSPQAGSGVQRQEFRRHLKFFNHEISGKIDQGRQGRPVRLPDLRPQTFDNFVNALFDPVGQVEAFRKLEALCNAFCTAFALDDKDFQRLVISKIHARVVTLAASENAETRADLYKKLKDRVVWAWTAQSEGQEVLRPLLTTSLVFVSSRWDGDLPKSKKRKRAIKEEDDEKNQFQLEPILNMKMLVELTASLGRLDVFGEEFMPHLMECCVKLFEYNWYNGREEWKMLPVDKLLPQELIPVIPLDD